MATLTRIARQACTLAALALALTTLGGCRNPFTPADPEPPAAGGVVENFSTPARLLDTISDAIADKGQTGGSAAYANAFADSTQSSERAFYAFHWPAAIDAWRAVSQRDPPNPWNLRLERAFYDYLVGYRPTASYTMTWNDDPTSESDDIEGTTPGFALIHRRYILFTSVSETDVTVIAVGYADIYLYKANGRWFIYRWQDRVDPEIGVSPADTEQLSMGARRLEST